MSTPTAAQLAAANLIAVTTLNGHPTRAWDPVAQNFPPATFYATPAAVLHTVTFVNTQGQTYAPLSLASGSTFTLPAKPTASPSGYVFSSWGDGAHTYNPGDHYTMPNNNVTMTAIFVPAPAPTPTPTPVPTPGPYPSGLTPPPVPTGYTRSFDDFTSTTLGPLWSGGYNGQSQAAQVGIFLKSHLVLNGDSWLRLEAYPDPANSLSSWMATPAIAASVNQWCGAGVQSVTRWPVGTIFTWACKWDTYPGMTPTVLTMGNNWPPEQDIIEADVSVKGAPQTGFNESFLYAPGPTQDQKFVSDGGIDLSQSHIWQAKWTTTGTVVTVDGNVVDNESFSSAMLSGVNGLQNPQFIAFQHQTGDPSNPPADSTITAANPVTFYVDWVAIDVPA